VKPIGVISAKHWILWRRSLTQCAGSGQLAHHLASAGLGILTNVMLQGFWRLVELVVMRLQSHSEVIEAMQLMVHIERHNVSTVSMERGSWGFELASFLFAESNVLP